MQLLNMSGVLTHFPGSDHCPSIINLSFAKGKISSAISNWTCEIGEGGDSDHAALTVTLSLSPPTFFPTRQHRKTDWLGFNRTMSSYPNNERNWESAETTLLSAENLMVTFRKDINDNVPWSQSGKNSQGWWTPSLTYRNTSCYWPKGNNAPPPPQMTKKPERKTLPNSGATRSKTHSGPIGRLPSRAPGTESSNPLRRQRRRRRRGASQ